MAVSVTIKQIALRTGLSVPTVGNVLASSGGRYSAQTRQRVFDAAQELGYRPNSSARAIRRGRTGCAALILSRSKQQTHSHIPAGLLDGLDDELALHNMHLTVSRLTDEQLTKNDFLPKVLREYMADGMIVNYTHEIPTAMLDLIHAHHAPAVWLNAKLKEDCVHPDDVGAAHAVTAQLIALGHRRIAFLHLISPKVFAGPFAQNWSRTHYSVADRAAGYAGAMVDAGLKPQLFYHDRYVDEAEHLATCHSMLAGADRPTAVIVYSERDASLLLCAAAQANLSVPRDLSIVVFAPVGLWLAGREVSVASVPTAEMGRQAVRMLLKKIASPNETCAPEAVSYGLSHDGETLAPPPADE
jgi:LacI family transcriptional regulator